MGGGGNQVGVALIVVGLVLFGAVVISTLAGAISDVLTHVAISL